MTESRTTTTLAADADYTRRPEPSELLPVLDALG